MACRSARGVGQLRLVSPDPVLCACAGPPQIFRGGKLEAPSDYAGPRDAAGIVTYMEKASAPPSKELKSAEEVRCCRPRLCMPAPLSGRRLVLGQASVGRRLIVLMLEMAMPVQVTIMTMPELQVKVHRYRMSCMAACKVIALRSRDVQRKHTQSLFQTSSHA